MDLIYKEENYKIIGTTMEFERKGILFKQEKNRINNFFNFVQK
jgi:hypothetical protein